MTLKSKIFFRVCLAVFIFAAVLFFASVFSETFAEFCTRTICAFTRNACAFITSILPFSLAEILVILGIPVLVIYAAGIVVCAIIRKKDFVYNNMRVFAGILMLFASLYFFNIGISYHRFPLEENLDLERKSVSSKQLYEGALDISDELVKYADLLEYDSEGASVMPYSFTELSDKLDAAYDKLSGNYDFIINVNAVSKRIALSEYMTYTHISGVYMPITGEANVNTNYPDYVVAFSTAHEKAHQRGIAGEDDANFIAYLACMCSDDDYVRYCANMSMFDYYLTAALKTDEEMYYSLIDRVNAKVRGEMKAYYEFFRKYSNSKASQVADKVNDTHLKLQGQEEGTVSYGLVVELNEAYRMKKKTQ